MTKKGAGGRGWRRLHNEELHNLHVSPIIRLIKSRRIRWAAHIAGMRNEKCLQNFGWKT